MLRKGSTPTGNNLSDDDFDPVSTHSSYGQSSKASAGASGGGGASSTAAGGSSKNEEDRHRRTIIIEKKNNSYGFTLQSYGIHYKREQELEMLTYVDHVEYDGPAYKAGMRQGDVILSINGVDMEKSDHQGLVSFIKDCDTRMRMVVLFEDCVRKVSLHMRYIHLQNVLQSKVTELEALLQREREILEGKWKTHSLPARKKASSQSVDTGLGNGDLAVNHMDDIYPNGTGNKTGAGGESSRRALASKTNTLPITRTAVSTENIGKLGAGGMHGIENFTPNAQVLLSYQYMDPTSRSNLKSSNSSGIDSTDYLGRDGSADGLNNYYSLKSNGSNKSEGNLNQPRSNCSTLSKDHKDNPHKSRHAQYYSNLQDNQERPAVAPKENSRCRQSYYCNPCMGGTKDPQNNGDNVSLDAYDLAGSPSMCCDVHQCVPIRRRRSRHHHHQQQQQTQQVVHQHPQQSKDMGSQQAVEPRKCHHHHQKHKHKHGSKCDEERPQRPKSQSNLPTNPTAAMLQYQKTHTRYYDLTGELASRCSLHSCSHNDCASTATTGSYCTSLSADTLNDWQDQGQDSMATPNHSGKNVQMLVHAPGSSGNPQYITQQQQYQQNSLPHSQLVTRFYHHTVQIQPTPDYQYQQNFIQKPKSWDNLSSKAVGGYAFGYGYVTSADGAANNSLKTSVQQYTNPQEPHSMCGGYRVHPQHHMASNNNSSSGNNTVSNRKPVYQHYGMKGAATNTDSSYPPMACQHAPQSTASSTTLITSTNTHNKTHCSTGTCGTGPPGNISGCSSNGSKK